MKNSIRAKVLIIYIVSIILFATTIIFFSTLYHRGYAERRLNSLIDRIEDEDNLKETLLTLMNSGFDVYVYDIETPLDETHISSRALGEERVESYNIEDSVGGNPVLIVNDRFIIEVNGRVIKEYVANLYLIIATVVIIYLLISLIILQYLLLRIVNPLVIISEELDKISKFEFDGKSIQGRRNDEIGDLAQNVENIKYSLKSYNNNRSVLVSALVHELKSPVATISTVIQLNKMGHEKYDDDATRAIIEDSISTISSITNLSLEVFEKKGIYKFVNSNVLETISHFLEQAKPVFDSKNLKLKIDTVDCSWRVDEESFEIVISNIVSNICNYAQDGTVVSVVVTKEMISFKNIISENITSGTGKGIKIISSLLSDMNLTVEYYEKDRDYHVIIGKKH